MSEGEPIPGIVGSPPLPDDDGRYGSSVPSLSVSTLHALKWNYGGAAAQALSQLLIGVVLARLLGPEPFGLVALAWLVIGLCNQVADFGLGSAVVQRKDLSERGIRSVFTLQVSAGVVMGVAIVALSVPLSRFFGRPELAPVLRWFSVVFVCQAFGQTSASLLKRRLDFRSLQVAQVSSYVLGYVALGIPAAYLGAGVWSLVCAQIAQRLLFTVQVLIRAKHSLKPLISLRAGGLAAFGSKVMGTNLLNWTIANADSGVVGKAFGSVALGLYNRALVLVTVPVTNLMIVLQGVLFSAYSRAQDRRDALKRAYLASVGLIALLLGPLFVGLAAASSSVILGLYGEEWRAAVPILTPLALAMPFHAVMGLAGPLVWGTGRVEVELRIQGVVALVMVAVLMGLSGTSVVWVAWAVLAVYMLRCLMITGALVRIAQIPPSSIARSLRGAFVASILSGLLVWALESWLRQSLVPPIARLAVDAVCAAAGYSLLLRAFPGLFFPAETSWALSRAAEASPPEFRRLIHRGLSWFGLPV